MAEGLNWSCTGRRSERHDPVPVACTELRQRGTMPAELRCPVCGLTKRVGYRALRRLEEAGLTEVNLAALPF